jgi:hypothetical protein
VRYIHVRIADRDMGESPVSVEVRVESRENVAAAALIYRFDRERRYYYAFAMAGGDQFRFYVRDGQGFRILHAARRERTGPGQFRKLSIAGSGREMRLFIDGELIKRVEDEGLPGGDTGIAAIGMGSFEFDNFTIYR